MKRADIKKMQAQEKNLKLMIGMLRDELHELYARRDASKPQPGDAERIEEISGIIHDHQTRDAQKRRRTW